MFRIVRERIDLDALLAAVTDPAAGAVVVFLGVTRNCNEGRQVTGLEYEAYPEMALREIEQIGHQAREQWPIQKIGIVHRVGPVPVGEVSVAIAVSSAHRDAAFQASRFAIDRLKEIVPIWKKEYFEGGAVWIGSQTGQAYPEGYPR